MLLIVPLYIKLFTSYLHKIIAIFENEVVFKDFDKSKARVIWQVGIKAHQSSKYDENDKEDALSLSHKDTFNLFLRSRTIFVSLCYFHSQLDVCCQS